MNHAQFAVFLLMHAVAIVGLFLVDWALPALLLAGAVLLVQGFGVTAFYHRYFSHRSFKTTRWFQLVGALLGNLAMQRDPLWWASHHRHHHLHSDEPADAHSPRNAGFLWSHMVWFMALDNCTTKEPLVKDFRKYAELCWLNRHPFAVPLGFAACLGAAGLALQTYASDTNLTVSQLLFWGWLLPTLATNHITYCVNSFGHTFGWQAYATGDDSRNSFLLALLTLGEGWHNNHHHSPQAARHGVRWWEIDATHGLLTVLASAGLIWDLRRRDQRASSTEAAA
ncbi:MAG: acyl-CoA desaturase [Gemmataceae bacterium]